METEAESTVIIKTDDIDTSGHLTTALFGLVVIMMVALIMAIALAA